MTTKKQITEKVKELKKLGLELITFQTHRKKNESEAGMFDYFLYGRGYLIFLECKIGRDRMSEKQMKLFDWLQYSMRFNNRLFVSIITDKDYEEVIKFIIEWIATLDKK